VQIRVIRVKVFTMTRRKFIKSAAPSMAAPSNSVGMHERDDLPVVKPVRRGKGRWLMFPRNVKISRATIAAAIRTDRDA
jgi:hypothetical protein